MVAALLVVSLELEESLQRVLFSRMKGPGVQAESPQLQRHPLETALPPRDQDCSSGSSATWRGEHTAGERPGRRGRTARGVWGGDPRSGPSSVRAAVRGSSVSTSPCSLRSLSGAHTLHAPTVLPSPVRRGRFSLSAAVAQGASGPQTRSRR